MSKLSKLFSVIILISTISVNAQKTWSLQECIKYALDNNIQVKRQELQTKLAQNNHEQSKYQRYPNLNAGGSHNWTLGRSVDRYTNEFSNTTVQSDNFSLQSSVVLFNGFQISNTIEQNKYIVESSLNDYEKAKNDIALQVATVYLQILFGEEALDIAQKQLEVTRLQLEKTKKLVDAGSKANGELLQMQAQEAGDKYNVTNAKNNLDVSYLTITQILELKTSEGFKVAKPTAISVSNQNVLLSVDDIYREAEAKMPQVKSGESTLKSYEKGLAIAKGQSYPELSLSGSYYSGYSDARTKITAAVPYVSTIGFVNGDPTMPVTTTGYSYTQSKYPFFEQLKDNASKSLSLNLSIPIFNRFSTRTSISNAKIRMQDASYNLAQVKKTLYQDIQKAHADALGAFEKFNSATEAVASYEEAFKYSQQRFDVGMLSSVDYNIAKNNLLKAQSDLIQAKYEYIFKIKVLDFYRGMPIILQ
ncbi:MAG: TolC family protein [Bacteroidota bacterium]|nr:TolC family protein [Bacteroidota bacterium]